MLRSARCYRRLFPLLLFAPGLLACDCSTSFSVCDEVKASDAVFIGVVESVSDSKSLLDSAKTQDQIEAILRKELSEENHATLRIKAVFRKEGDEPKDDRDDDHQDEKLAPGKSIDVWTDTGECGYEFRKGETYLVYGFEEEQSGRLQTSRCTRTARVSDAGEDLAYLFFYKGGKSESARVEGFTSSDPTKQLSHDPFHYSGRIESPVSDVEVELKSGHGSRYTKPDGNGRFVFDGLAEDTYRLYAYDLNEPGDRTPLTHSLPLRVLSRSCNTTILVIRGSSRP